MQWRGVFLPLFFFQAEDGIRDIGVTGVQTCALPIYAEPLDVPSLAGIAHVSEAHFIRTFRATFGETPHRYLQRRRVERAMWLLRSTDRSVTDVCMAVGFSSLGTFSRVFAEVVGESPSVYRRRGPLAAVLSCFGMRWLRPSEHSAPGDRKSVV